MVTARNLLLTARNLTARNLLLTVGSRTGGRGKGGCFYLFACSSLPPGAAIRLIRPVAGSGKPGKGRDLNQPAVRPKCIQKSERTWRSGAKCCTNPCRAGPYTMNSPNTPSICQTPRRATGEASTSSQRFKFSASPNPLFPPSGPAVGSFRLTLSPGTLSRKQSIFSTDSGECR